MFKACLQTRAEGQQRMTDCSAHGEVTKRVLFRLQGTNAHALIATVTSTPAIAAGAASEAAAAVAQKRELALCPRRHWVALRVPLLISSALGGGASRLILQVKRDSLCLTVSDKCHCCFSKVSGVHHGLSEVVLFVALCSRLRCCDLTANVRTNACTHKFAHILCGKKCSHISLSQIFA